MFKVLYIDDKVSEVQHMLDAFIEEKILHQESNFEVKVLGPVSFEDMGAKIFNLLVKEPKYDALILDWNLSETADEAGNRVSYRAAELGQYLRREIAEQERGDACFPIFILSAQKFLSTLYLKDKASHDIFDRVYEKEGFFSRANTQVIVNEITLFIKSYKTLQKWYKGHETSKRAVYPIREILPALLNRSFEDLSFSINFNELNIPHPYGYLKFIHQELIKKSGPLVSSEVLAARLGLKSEEIGTVLPHLSSCKYSGVMSDGYERWWVDQVGHWWQNEISSEPMVFLDASDRVTALNKRFGLNLLPATAIDDAYSSFFWHVSKVTRQPLDEADAIRLEGTTKFDWQDNEFLSIADYLSGSYQLQDNESINLAELQDKIK